MTDTTFYKLIKLTPITTEGKPGNLIEFNINKICKENNIDFNIYKCFYVNDLDTIEGTRGNHSNKNATEILVCLQGTFEITLYNGKKEEVIKINKNDAIFIDKNIWIKYYNFKNCVIMAFVNVDITEKESCYDFKEFMILNNS